MSSPPLIADVRLDARGLSCPQPILQTKRCLAKMTAGQILEVISDDPSGFTDFAIFTSKTGHQLRHQSIAAGVATFYLQHK